MPEIPTSPLPLRLGAFLAGLEGLALLVLAVLQLVNLSSDRVTLDLALAVFFAAYGVLLIVGGVALARLVPWPRGLVLISQLILLGLAWGLRDHPLAAVVSAVIAVATIAGLVHPSSIEALERARAQRQAPDSDSRD